MQSALEHMRSDYAASACGLHVRSGNRAALRLYRDTLGFHIGKTEVQCAPSTAVMPPLLL
jgi:ribosomal protein S18 acetylase RimI-like enzyme